MKHRVALFSAVLAPRARPALLACSAPLFKSESVARASQRRC